MIRSQKLPNLLLRKSKAAVIPVIRTSLIQTVAEQRLSHAYRQLKPPAPGREVKHRFILRSHFFIAACHLRGSKAGSEMIHQQDTPSPGTLIQAVAQESYGFPEFFLPHLPCRIPQKPLLLLRRQILRRGHMTLIFSADHFPESRKNPPRISLRHRRCLKVQTDHRPLAHLSSEARFLPDFLPFEKLNRLPVLSGIFCIPKEILQHTKSKRRSEPGRQSQADYPALRVQQLLD